MYVTLDQQPFPFWLWDNVVHVKFWSHSPLSSVNVIELHSSKPVRAAHTFPICIRSVQKAMNNMSCSMHV